MTHSNRNAIRYFILATAARHVRGQEDQHWTMLIHTAVLNSVHLATRAAVESYLRNLALRLDDVDENLFREMEKIWSDESETVDADQFGNEKVSFDRLRPLLSVVASSIDVKVENWRSQDRIDYSVPGRRYIVIGGNVQLGRASCRERVCKYV